MPKRIVYTRHDGEVAVCAPSLKAMAYMTGGGGRWDGFPRGFLDRQIAKQAEYGVGEWAAARFVRAMQFGGLSNAEAYAIVRDRFCGHLGTGHELWDVADIPADRWFRDAWVRSHNGGPIDICMKRARRIQWARARSFVARENKRRTLDIDGFDQLLELHYQRLRRSIRAASTPNELKGIWPVAPSSGRSI